MRILVLTNLYPPAAIGGHERLCMDVVERFRRSEHEVTVLTSTFGGLYDDPDPGVHRLFPMYWDGGEFRCPPRLKLFRSERRNARILVQLLRELAPDVVSVWGMGGWSLGLLATVEASGVPVVYVIPDDWLVYGRRADCWTSKLERGPDLARRAAAALGAPAAPTAFGRTSRFCFVSEFTRSRAVALTGIDLATSTVVPAGINAFDFPLGDPHESRTWGWRVLFVGRLAPAKGLDVAIRALARLPEATLTVMGEGGPRWYHDELWRLVRADDTRERITWGRCERSELAPVYRSADALVFPSSGSEPFGLVPLEAMACATPVVATTGGGSAEFFVHGENCLLFEPGDLDGLVGALNELAGDADLRRRLVAGGLRTASRLTVDRSARILERIHLAAAAGETYDEPYLGDGQLEASR